MTSTDDVRAIVGDLVIADDTGEYLFSDAHIATLLELNDGSPYRAAADLLRALAVDQVYLYKASLHTDDMSVDGAQVAAQLRLTATEFDNKAKRLEDADPAFEIIPFSTQDSCHPEAAAYPYPDCGRWY